MTNSDSEEPVSSRQLILNFTKADMRRLKFNQRALSGVERCTCSRQIRIYQNTPRLCRECGKKVSLH